MKKILLMTGFMLAGVNAFCQQFSWVQQVGDTLLEKTNAIATDADGNIYLAGSFRGTVDFDPGNGNTVLTVIGDSDIFLQKLDKTGALVWVKQIGGTQQDEAYNVSLDTAGNIYLSGYFTGVADFDPSANTQNLTSAGTTDAFVMKLDKTGTYQWAKQVGGLVLDMGYNAIANDAGEVYFCGMFNGTADLDPGAAVLNAVSAGGQDAFLVKLDAAGDLLWGRAIGGTSADVITELLLDNSGALIAAGTFMNTADLNPGGTASTVTAAGISDIFVAQYNTAGLLQWAKVIGSTDIESPTGLATDVSGNLILTGNFMNTTDLDPGPATATFTSAGGFDAFVAKLDASGNYVWGRAMGGSGVDQSYAIALDDTGNIYTTGHFSSTADFDPGAGTANMTAQGSGWDVFISKLKPNGDYSWAKQLAGSDYGFGTGIVLDGGDLIITGWFTDTTDFDPGTGVQNRISAKLGMEDYYVLKLSSSTGVTDIATVPTWAFYPNPTSGKVYVQAEQPIEAIRVTDLAGKIIYAAQPEAKACSFEIGMSGMYFVTVSIDGTSATKKLVVQ